MVSKSTNSEEEEKWKKTTGKRKIITIHSQDNFVLVVETVDMAAEEARRMGMIFFFV